MVVHPEDVPGARGVASGVGAAEASGVDDGLADGDDSASALGEGSTEGEAAISLPAGASLAAGDGVGGVPAQAPTIAARTETMTMCRLRWMHANAPIARTIRRAGCGANGVTAPY